MAKSEFTCRAATIGELSATDMLDLLELRARVFVVEQDCVYQDPGPEDRHPATLHLMLHNSEGKLAAYARLLAPGVDGNEPAIGRVVNDPDQRGQGLGKLLMDHSIQQVESHWPGQPTRLHAQTYLEKFYRGFRFEPVGDVYLLDGIDHIEMVRPAQQRGVESDLFELVFDGLSLDISTDLVRKLRGGEVPLPEENGAWTSSFSIDRIEIGPGCVLGNVGVRWIGCDDDVFDVELNFKFRDATVPTYGGAVVALQDFGAGLAKTFGIEVWYAGLDPASDEDTRLFTGTKKGPWFELS